MLKHVARQGEELFKKHGLDAGSVACMFAACVPAQRKGIMANYKKDGSEK